MLGNASEKALQVVQYENTKKKISVDNFTQICGKKFTGISKFG